MELHYKKIGSGQPLLVLHGLMGMLDNWQTPAKELAKHFEVYLIDQRNHGHSPHTEDFSYQHLAQDIFEFIFSHHLVDPHILGHSMGGKAAMQFAQENPQMLDKLVVADISPRGYQVRHREILDALLSVDFSTLTSRKQVQDHLMERLEVPSIVYFLTKNLYWKEKGKLAWRFNLPVIDATIEEISGAINNTRYEGETLFIRGGNSNYVTDEKDLPIIQQIFPNHQIDTVANAGHWLHAEQPDDFLKKVIAFLTA